MNNVIDLKTKIKAAPSDDILKPVQDLLRQAIDILVELGTEDLIQESGDSNNKTIWRVRMTKTHQVEDDKI